MVGGVVMALIKDGRKAFRVTEFVTLVIGVLSAWLLVETTAGEYSFVQARWRPCCLWCSAWSCC